MHLPLCAIVIERVISHPARGAVVLASGLDIVAQLQVGLTDHVPHRVDLLPSVQIEGNVGKSRILMVAVGDILMLFALKSFVEFLQL